VSSDKPRRWVCLALGLALMALAVVGLSHGSSSTGTGVIAQARARGLESDAYFYTEVSDVGAFLEDEGRYGAPRLAHPATR
jgi:hypothetical protein